MARSVTKKVKVTTQKRFGSRVRDVKTVKTLKGLKFVGQPGKTDVTMFGLKKAR